MVVSEGCLYGLPSPERRYVRGLVLLPIRSWTALGIGEAAKKFRRVKGHKQLNALVVALRPAKTRMEPQTKVA